MCTISAPTYATLTVGYIEVYFYDIYKVKWGSEFKEFPIGNWSRFSNDCETPLDRKKVQSQELIDTINSINEAIPFTMELSDRGTNFFKYIN